MLLFWRVGLFVPFHLHASYNLRALSNLDMPPPTWTMLHCLTPAMSMRMPSPLGLFFLALMTFIWGQHQTYSVGTFSFSWCTVDGARVYGTIKEALATGHAIPVTGQFLPFVATTNDPTLLRWTGRFAPECEFQSSHVVFLDAQMDGDGRWIIPVDTLSAFVKTAQVPNCPQLRAECSMLTSQATGSILGLPRGLGGLGCPSCGRYPCTAKNPLKTPHPPFFNFGSGGV